jgi:choloylglycine hydrolase
MPVTVALEAVGWPAADACTRAVYFGKQGQVVTGRSMDWFRDMDTNLWLFPRGMEQDGAAGPNSLSWASKYGSVAATVYEAGTADGLNEKGLMANLLYLTESEYPAADGRPGL